VEAWAIVKAGGLELAVRDVSFGNQQEALRRLAAYNPAQVKAVLVPEPENLADPSAVVVMVGVQGGRGLFRLELRALSLLAWHVVTDIDNALREVEALDGGAPGKPGGA
jgi:hypothetical protein